MTMPNKLRTIKALESLGGWDAACESLLAEADRLRNEVSEAAATTPSCLLGDGHRKKAWRATYYREAAEWLLGNETNMMQVGLGAKRITNGQVPGRQKPSECGIAARRPAPTSDSATERSEKTMSVESNTRATKEAGADGTPPFDPVICSAHCCATCKFWSYDLVEWRGEDKADDEERPCAAMDSESEHKLGAKSYGHYGYEAGVNTRRDFLCAAYQPNEKLYHGDQKPPVATKGTLNES